MTATTSLTWEVARISRGDGGLVRKDRPQNRKLAFVPGAKSQAASPRFTLPAQVFGPSLDFVWPYAYQMNLTVEKEILRNFSIDYQGGGQRSARCRRRS